jgi:hypothetical protein
LSGLPPETKTARNERRKAVAATLNAVGVAVLLATAVRPFLGESVAGETILLGVTIFVASQGGRHAILRGLEE